MKICYLYKFGKLGNISYNFYLPIQFNHLSKNLEKNSKKVT